jgi:hypothetical protein
MQTAFRGGEWMSMYFACLSLAPLALLVAATAAFGQPITDEQIEYSRNPIPLKMARCYMQPRIALEWSCFRAVEIERSTARRRVQMHAQIPPLHFWQYGEP